MIILKELFKERQRSDGYCQIVIRVHHNGKSRRVNTPVYTAESCWDTLHSRINEQDNDYEIKNEIIESIYRRISGKIQALIDQIIDERLDEMIYALNNDMSPNNGISPKTNTSCDMTDCDPESAHLEHGINFLDLIARKAAASVSHNTRRGYEGFMRYVERRFGKELFASGINQDFTNRFISAIDMDYGSSESMRRFMISRYNAVVNFGKDSGLLAKRLKIALPPYYLLPADRNLSGEEICNIFSAFTEAIYNDPKIESRETEALGIFILDIAFQGLAPVDLANLRVKSLKFSTIHAFEKNPRKYRDDDEYRRMYDSPENRLRTVTFSTTRKKTGRPVQIVASTLGIECFIRKLMAGKDGDDYLLSCFDKTITYSASQRQNRLANYFNMMARNLNKGISRHYVKHNLGISRRVTFYFARHAFCNLVDGMDIPRHIIQNMVGYRNSVLETSYLRPITPWEQAKISHTLLSRYFT